MKRRSIATKISKMCRIVSHLHVVEAFIGVTFYETSLVRSGLAIQHRRDLRLYEISINGLLSL